MLYRAGAAGANPVGLPGSAESYSLELNSLGMDRADPVEHVVDIAAVKALNSNSF
jgi:hypothetical protein